MTETKNVADEWVVEDAHSYRELADALIGTMPDPDKYDRDEAEIAVLLGYVKDIGPIINARPAMLDIAAERVRQDAKWGEQNHPDGTGARVAFAGRLCYMADAAVQHQRAAESAAGNVPGLEHHGPLTWRHILLEEVFEALAEDDPAALREELTQVAAVATAWIEALDRRNAMPEDGTR